MPGLRPAGSVPFLYWRDARSGGGPGRKIWVRRVRYVGCARSDALLPPFLLEGRLDVVDDIGGVIGAVTDGGGVVGRVAKARGVPYTTARDWLRRFSARAPMLATGFAAAAVDFGAEAGVGREEVVG